MSLKARKELCESIKERYRRSPRKEKKNILDEFATVNGVTFASVRLLGTEKEDESYFFCKYELASEDELTVYAIADDQYEELSELESVAAVRQFFEERMSEPDFFDEEFGTYRKLEEWIWPWEAGYSNFGK